MTEAQAEQQKEQTRKLFNAVSAQYDAGPGCFAYFGRRLVERVGVAPGQRALDVASGRGAALFPAAERAGARGEVIGVDIAEEMARATNAEAERRSSSVRVRVQDAEDLGFADASFDCVLCGFGIMFFPDQNRALREFHRVLKPGGWLGVSTWRESQAEEVNRALIDIGVGGGSPPGWITDADVLEQLLRRNGFEDVKVEADPQVFRYSGADEYWQQARGTGLRGKIDSLDAAKKKRLEAAFAERVKPFQKSDGLYVRATALIATARK